MRLTTRYYLVWFLFIHALLVAQVRKDHVLHFGAGMIAGGAGALVASELSDGNRFWTFTGAVAGSAIAGIAKEAIDSGKPDNSWDNSDLAATVLGGITVGLTIDIFTGKARRKKKANAVGTAAYELVEFRDRGVLLSP